MHTTQNIKKVSFLFFLAFTGAHLASTLLLARGYHTAVLELINGIFDIPAILGGILYAFTSLKLYLEEIGKKTDHFDLIAGVIGGIILIGILYINFLYNPAA